jgi:hypothetical protein
MWLKNGQKWREKTFLILYGRKMVVPHQSQSRRFSRFLSLAGLLFGSLTLFADSRKQKNRDKGFSTSTLPRHTHTLYVLLFPFSLHFCIKEGGE